MERLQKRELSRKLAQATHISIGDAEKFVAAFFGTLAEGVKVDGEVEVYGFGTFSQDGFAPCPQLADAVNKPFVNFAPLEIEADVEVDEIINQEVEEKATSEAVGAGLVSARRNDRNEMGCAFGGRTQGPPLQEELENAEETGGHDGPPLQEDSESQEQKEPESPEPQETEEPESTETREPEPPASQEPELSGTLPARKSRIIWLWLASLTVVVLIIAGYFFRQYSAQLSAEKAAQAKTDSIETARIDSLHRDSIRQANIQEIPCHYTLEEAKKLMPYSAYRVEGTLTTDTVKRDQTLEDIAKLHGLPYGEFIIQLHNGIESVKEGQIIKIPHLKRK